MSGKLLMHAEKTRFGTGLNAGDVIQAFNAMDVSNAAGMRSELLKPRTDDSVVLRVEWDDAYRFVPLELE